MLALKSPKERNFLLKLESRSLKKERFKGFRDLGNSGLDCRGSGF